MKENIDVLSQSRRGLNAFTAAVVSSLAIVVLVERYRIQLQQENVSTLLSCLALEADQAAKKCSLYIAVLAEFSEGLRE